MAPAVVSPAEPLPLLIPREFLAGLIRERVDALLGTAEIARIRQELLLMVACVSSEEGGLLVGMSPRAFRDLCERVAIPTEPLGYKTPRYRLAHLLSRLDDLAVGARVDKELLASRLRETTASLLRRIEEMRSPLPPSVQRAA